MGLFYWYESMLINVIIHSFVLSVGSRTPSEIQKNQKIKAVEYLLIRHMPDHSLKETNSSGSRRIQTPIQLQAPYLPESCQAGGARQCFFFNENSIKFINANIQRPFNISYYHC